MTTHYYRDFVSSTQLTIFKTSIEVPEGEKENKQNKRGRGAVVGRVGMKPLRA